MKRLRHGTLVDLTIEQIRERFFTWESVCSLHLGDHPEAGRGMDLKRVHRCVDILHRGLSNLLKIELPLPTYCEPYGRTFRVYYPDWVEQAHARWRAGPDFEAHCQAIYRELYDDDGQVD